MDSRSQRELLVQSAIDELNARRFAVTEQYLDVLTLAKAADGSPSVARIDDERSDNTAIVYFPIEGERFFLVVYLDTGPTPEVRGVGIEAGSRVFFKATSSTLTLAEMSKLTTLSPTEGWNRGEPRKAGPNTTFAFSCFVYEPNPHVPEAVEEKMKTLLRSLGKDHEGIKRLSGLADATIQVVMYNYYGNGSLDGIHLDHHTLQDLVNLGLAVDFDLYVGGQPIR